MDRTIRLKIGFCCLCLCLASILLSCGSSQKAAGSSKKTAEHLKENALTFEQKRKFDYFFHEAVRQKGLGNMEEAFELYSHCLEIDSASASTLYELGKLYMYLGQAEKGESFLRKAMLTEPGNYWYKETLAAYYQRKGETEKGIAVIEDMVEQFPSRLEPLMALVDLYNRSQDYQKVIHTLDRLEKLDGKSEQISMEKFRMYLAMDDNENAFAEIENLAKEYPYEMRYLTMLGDVYLENGKEEEAYSTFRKVLSTEPGYAPAMLSMATYYNKTGQDSLYRVQLDSLLLNQKVQSNTKVNIMRQLIMRSEMFFFSPFFFFLFFFWGCASEAVRLCSSRLGLSVFLRCLSSGSGSSIYALTCAGLTPIMPKMPLLPAWRISKFTSSSGPAPSAARAFSLASTTSLPVATISFIII